jgi:isopentenyl-diphosphate delta-isomerase
MKEVTPIGSRKTDHIRINLEEDVKSRLTTGLEQYQFTHYALPEINLSDVDPGLDLFGKHLSAPLLISSMTGGTAQAAQINQILSLAAEQAHIAIGVGSQRIAIDNPDLAGSFQVRRQAPTALLFANLGAIQLNYGYGVEECQRAVDMIEADVLILHLNSLQEALQPEGQTNFFGLLTKIEHICRSLPIPVVAKEVGWGFSARDVSLLAQAGIAAIDVAGAGGTSWSQVEMHRAQTNERRQLAAAFQDWGIPTAQAILNVLSAAPDIKVIASGGLRTGLEIAKCIALGASMGGMAGPFLKAASQSLDEVLSQINLLREEIRVCMFATGSLSLSQLKQGKLVRR